ncbi:PQQ-dependent sugar dehydrogenase [Cytobacillus purgationiresistens]|uniref:Glucose/arabinose dehydrogenase n=1 Tax=Cytobacillus purgationiresistens TaxID=863449 RepID=A0ABU0AKM9_9BACI|nr:PQQ-dependent sugar dehydrogenase [Cytobacillus purgationiresistens]MDQ0271813.1 glucose/arabinose dehydrogenase [Cytobacillus purgationiresistens]
MKKIMIALLGSLLIIAGCSENNGAKEPNEDAVEETDRETGGLPAAEPEVIAEELNTPWSIDRLGETFYLSERPGKIVIIENGEKERQEVELEKELSTVAEAGLLGFVLSPDYENSKEAYAYYTFEEDGNQYNRVVVLQQDNSVWREDRVLLDDIPSGEYHHGGRLKIGPDEKLYITTGDATDPDLAQDLDSLAGKVLRMNLDGSIPEDNPYEESYVYSYGHRNPQGLAWSEDGKMYESEHGPTANDEINIIEVGKNYGWPEITGEEEKEGMESPLFTSGDKSTWAPSGIAYTDEKIYAAALRGTAVLEFDLQTGEKREVVTELGRIRDLYIEDGVLYFISNNTDGRGNPLDNDDHLYQIDLNEM